MECFTKVKIIAATKQIYRLFRSGGSASLLITWFGGKTVTVNFKFLIWSYIHGNTSVCRFLLSVWKQFNSGNKPDLSRFIFVSFMFIWNEPFIGFIPACNRETINTIKHAEDMNMFACGALKQSLHKKGLEFPSELLFIHCTYRLHYLPPSLSLPLLWFDSCTFCLSHKTHFPFTEN